MRVGGHSGRERGRRCNKPKDSGESNKISAGMLSFTSSGKVKPFILAIDIEK